MDTPANARPPSRLPVFWPINPTTADPVNPPRFTTELIKAMPLAAENPAKNSPGIDQKGLRELQFPPTPKRLLHDTCAPACDPNCAKPESFPQAPPGRESLLQLRQNYSNI